MAATALDVMKDPELLKKAKEEHGKIAGKEKYVSPIPDGVQPGLTE